MERSDTKTSLWLYASEWRLLVGECETGLNSHGNKLGMEWKRARQVMMKDGRLKLDAAIALSAQPHADPQQRALLSNIHGRQPSTYYIMCPADNSSKVNFQ